MTTTRQPIPVRRFAVRVLAVAAVALVLVFGAGGAVPAGAHDGDAIIAVEAAHPAGTGVHYIVRVTWQNDGHPAADATVTASAVGSDGTQLTPVTLAAADSDGRYAGVVDFPAPGSWTVRITSIDPTGTLEQAQEVAPPPTTAPAEGGSEVTTGQGEADDGNGFAPADDGTGASDEQAQTADSESDGDGDGASDDDSGGMPIYLAVAAAAVVLIGAVTAVNIIRRNRPDLSGGEGTGGADTGAEAGTGATSGGETTSGTGDAADAPRAGGGQLPDGDGTPDGDPASSRAATGGAPDGPTSP
jgi:hypothetical protein